ncbi:MAG: hypothetical protein WCG95_00780 [bacterium]
MASIIDSFRETFSDNLSFLKISILSIPVYYSYQAYVNAKNDYSGFFWLASLTLFFLFGVLINVTNRVLNEQDSVFPSLNPFKLAFTSLKGIIAIGPLTWISCALANYICSSINIISWLDTTLKVIIWFVVAAIITTAFLMFATKEKITNAYNIKLLFDKAGDMIVVLVFFIFQLLVINLPTTVFIGYTLLVLFGFGPVLNAFIAIAFVFNIAVTGHYLAQVHYEIFSYEKINF